MAGEVELGFTISKEAMKLIKSGQAILSSGGVRLLDGTMYEMVKPASALLNNGSRILSVAGNATPGINTVSSLANNIQSVMIQKSVDLANTRILEMTHKMSLLQNSIATVSTLSWVGCAVGMVNCGISIAGFKMTLDRLKEVTNQISEISSLINREIENHLKRDFNQFRMNIQADMSSLENYSLTDADRTMIDQHMATIIAYLTEVIERFEKREIDGQLACSIIFNLSIGFCEEVKEYTAQYFYVNGKMPPNYDEWISVLDRINSESFRNHLKRFLAFEMKIPMKNKYLAFSNATLALEVKHSELDYNRELIRRLTYKQYQNQDSLLHEYIREGKIEEGKDFIYIPVG